MSLILTFLIRSLIWRIPGLRLIATLGVLLAAGGIFLYILYALALGTIARSRRVRWPFLAWVPVASLYTLGSCADDERGRHGLAAACPACGAAAAALWLMAAWGGHGDALAAGGWLVALSAALTAAAVVLAYIALSWVYRSVSRAAAALTVLSIIFPFLIPIFLYILRNRLPGGGRRVRGVPPGD